eukprot:2263854-Prymnesium_polylepis.1
MAAKTLRIVGDSIQALGIVRKFSRACARDHPRPRPVTARESRAARTLRAGVVPQLHGVVSGSNLAVACWHR